MGKTELNTLCSPVSSRSFGRRSICRNRSYDFFWTSIRLGIGIEVLIRKKSTRSRVAPFARFSIFTPTADGLATHSMNINAAGVPLPVSCGVNAVAARVADQRERREADTAG